MKNYKSIKTLWIHRMFINSHDLFMYLIKWKDYVVTLTLDSWLKQGGSQGCGPRRSQGVTSHAPRNVRKCEGMNPHTLKVTPILGESWWTPEFSKGDCRGQNSMAWGVSYIIENILERRCLKWACMTHLDISNTSYGKRKVGSEIGILTFDH